LLAVPQGEKETVKVHPIAELFPLLEGEEFDALVESIRANGFDPARPVLLFEKKILDGRNRYRAAKKAGVKPIIRTWRGDNPWSFVWRENAVRRHLEPSQKAAIAIEFVRGSESWADAHEKDRSQSKSEGAKKREEAKRTGVPRGTRVVRHPERHEKVKLARLAGVSPRTAARALAVRERAPKQFERVKRGEISAQKALGEIKTQEKRSLAEQIRRNPVVTPDGRYQVIAIDPPWKYDARTEDHTHRGKTDYPEMTVEEICKLPVSGFAQKDCILWLWTTNAFMRAAFECLDAWGFEEKTILTWDKELIGVGNWLRNVTEHCILAVRGKPVVSLTNQPTIIREKRREHSRKPEAFYKLVEKLCPGSKLEMFAREERKGWIVWGAESKKFKKGTKP
jgi:N6-adenosine-specific RNA methylase IME4